MTGRINQVAQGPKRAGQARPTAAPPRDSPPVPTLSSLGSAILRASGRPPKPSHPIVRRSDSRCFFAATFAHAVIPMRATARTQAAGFAPAKDRTAASRIRDRPTRRHHLIVTLLPAAGTNLPTPRSERARKRPRPRSATTAERVARRAPHQVPPHDGRRPPARGRASQQAPAQSNAQDSIHRAFRQAETDRGELLLSRAPGHRRFRAGTCRLD